MIPDIRYVQHISGQGAKWPLQQVSLTNPKELPMWFVYDPRNSNPFTLPKCEYELVPFEQWVDVTESCHVLEGMTLLGVHGGYAVSANGYRFRKVHVGPPDNSLGWKHDWAFIVEKKEPA